jgi:hypothetical protein
MQPPQRLAEHKIATMSRKRRGGAKSFPKGVGYSIPIPRDLLGCPAWLAMSHQCRKLVDALMMEWANHGGEENGMLKVPYDQLQAMGLRRQTVLNVIVEAKALGIIHPVRGQRSYGVSCVAFSRPLRPERALQCAFALQLCEGIFDSDVRLLLLPLSVLGNTLNGTGEF